MSSGGRFFPCVRLPRRGLHVRGAERLAVCSSVSLSLPLPLSTPCTFYMLQFVDISCPPAPLLPPATRSASSSTPRSSASRRWLVASLGQHRSTGSAVLPATLPSTSPSQPWKFPRTWTLGVRYAHRATFAPRRARSRLLVVRCFYLLLLLMFDVVVDVRGDGEMIGARLSDRCLCLPLCPVRCCLFVRARRCCGCRNLSASWTSPRRSASRRTNSFVPTGGSCAGGDVRALGGPAMSRWRRTCTGGGTNSGRRRRRASSSCAMGAGSSTWKGSTTRTRCESDGLTLCVVPHGRACLVCQPASPAVGREPGM